MIAEASVGVRGKLDLMSNFYTFMDIILWVESAREIHKSIFRNFCIIMDLLFCAFIILFYLFPYLDYYYKFRHFEMQTAKAIPIGYRGDARGLKT